jgi:hypothetical protein
VLLAAGADIDRNSVQIRAVVAAHADRLLGAVRNVAGSRGACARVSMLEAMLFGDDVGVERLTRPRTSTLPVIQPNGGSLLAFARTTFTIDRFLEIGVASDKKDR